MSNKINNMLSFKDGCSFMADIINQFDPTTNYGIGPELRDIIYVQDMDHEKYCMAFDPGDDGIYPIHLSRKVKQYRLKNGDIIRFAVMSTPYEYWIVIDSRLF